jgi:hypothetical protein
MRRQSSGGSAPFTGPPSLSLPHMRIDASGYETAYAKIREYIAEAVFRV